jgi:predicted TIM-barrel fold metal-dependent hydrolase
LGEIIRRCDRDRLVWGSDHGFSFADAVGYRKGLLDLVDLDDDGREAIFCRNPMRLFGLSTEA